MTKNELQEIEKFATDLKIDFSILENPKDFGGRVLNITNESAIKKIDLALDRSRMRLDK
jgi:hypothetical protein